MKEKIKKRLFKIVQKLYFRYGPNYDTSDFWKCFVVYRVPKHIDGKILITEINRKTRELELRHEFEIPILKVPERTCETCERIHSDECPTPLFVT